MEAHEEGIQNALELFLFASNYWTKFRFIKSFETNYNVPTSLKINILKSIREKILSWMYFLNFILYPSKLLNKAAVCFGSN